MSKGGRAGGRETKERKTGSYYTSNTKYTCVITGDVERRPSRCPAYGWRKTLPFPLSLRSKAPAEAIQKKKAVPCGNMVLGSRIYICTYNRLGGHGIRTICNREREERGQLSSFPKGAKLNRQRPHKRSVHSLHHSGRYGMVWYGNLGEGSVACAERYR